jgi:hypothetical protein
MPMARAKAKGFEPSGNGIRPNRALRDARGSGSWLKKKQARCLSYRFIVASSTKFAVVPTSLRRLT